MAKGQHLSRHQKGIVNRYYEHADTITLTKLQEIVSDLYLATGDKAAAKLWKSAETALAKTGADAPRVAKILADKNVVALATLVGELSGPSKGPSKPR
jgi:hypothetical protein